MAAVLVTGAAGLIGSHLAEHFARDGYEVWGIDDLSGAVRWAPAGCRFTAGDVRERRLVATGADLAGVFHLASPASVAHFLADPVKTLTTNVTGTANVAELALKADAPLIALSSCEAYGQIGFPNREGEEGIVHPGSPRACYEEGKRGLEAVVAAYRRQGLRAIAVRLFSTYGPRMGIDGRLMSSFITAALEGRPLPIYGDGSQVQAPCYVDDVVGGLIALWRRLEQGPIDADYLNLGHPHGWPVHQIAALVVGHVGTGTAFEHFPARPGESAGRVPDLTRLRGVVDWSPTVSLVDGIRLTAAFYEAYRWDGTVWVPR